MAGWSPKVFSADPAPEKISKEEKQMKNWDPMKEDYECQVYNSHKPMNMEDVVRRYADQPQVKDKGIRDGIQLYVSNIPHKFIDQKKLRDIFSTIGEVKYMKFVTMNEELPYSYAFVTFKSELEAVTAVKRFNGRNLDPTEKLKPLTVMITDSSRSQLSKDDKNSSSKSENGMNKCEKCGKQEIKFRCDNCNKVGYCSGSCLAKDEVDHELICQMKKQCKIDQPLNPVSQKSYSLFEKMKDTSSDKLPVRNLNKPTPIVTELSNCPEASVRKFIKISIGETVNLIVTYVDKPNKFYCVINDQATEEKMHEFNNFLNSALLEPLKGDPKVGTLVVAPFEDCLYRAVITHKSVNASQPISVLFVDFGNRESASLVDLKTTNNERFVNFQYQSIECSFQSMEQFMSVGIDTLVEGFEFKAFVAGYDGRAHLLKLPSDSNLSKNDVISSVNLNSTFINQSTQKVDGIHETRPSIKSQNESISIRNTGKSQNEPISVRHSGNEQMSMRHSAKEQISMRHSGNEQISMRHSGNEQISMRHSTNEQMSVRHSSNEQSMNESIRPTVTLKHLASTIAPFESNPYQPIPLTLKKSYTVVIKSINGPNFYVNLADSFTKALSSAVQKHLRQEKLVPLPTGEFQGKNTRCIFRSNNGKVNRGRTLYSIQDGSYLVFDVDDGDKCVVSVDNIYCMLDIYNQLTEQAILCTADESSRDLIQKLHQSKKEVICTILRQENLPVLKYIVEITERVEKTDNPLPLTCSNLINIDPTVKVVSQSPFESVSSLSQKMEELSTHSTSFEKDLIDINSDDISNSFPNRHIMIGSRFEALISHFNNEQDFYVHLFESGCTSDLNIVSTLLVNNFSVDSPHRVPLNLTNMPILKGTPLIVQDEEDQFFYRCELLIDMQSADEEVPALAVDFGKLFIVTPDKCFTADNSLTVYPKVAVNCSLDQEKSRNSVNLKEILEQDNEVVFTLVFRELLPDGRYFVDLVNIEKNMDS